MSLRQYIAIMIIATILCWVSFGFVVVNIDPFDANNVSFLFFYVSTFFSLLGTLSLVIFGFYSRVVKKREPLYKLVQESFKDSMVLSVSLTVLLFLQGNNLLTKWNTAIFAGILISLSVFSYFNRRVPKLKV